MRFWIAFVAVMVLIFGGLNAFAQEKKECSATADAKACCQAKSAEGSTKLASCQSACSKANDAAHATIPALTYKVGDKEVPCCQTAADLAKETKGKVQFVVAGKTYEKECDAMAAYAEVLDQHLNKITSVQFAVGDECVACPITAEEMAKKAKTKVQYQLASFKFAEKTAAEKAAGAAKEAASKVAMKLYVGDECYQCPVSAKDASTKSGKTVEYAVGESRTACELTAKVELAKAKLEAAIKTLSQAAGA